MNQEFIKPRLTGKRFDGHTIPLEILKDFAAFEEMVVEVAKWKYKQAHPDNKRVQRNFSKGLELHLAQVTPGSAVPVLVLAFGGLFPADNAKFFEDAQQAIVQAIDCAASGQPQELPPHLLSYFDRFGRGLREGEAVEFSRPDRGDVVLTPELRKRLIRAAHVEAWTQEVTLRGRVCEADHTKSSFQLELTDGTKLLASLADQHYDTVMDAFHRYRRDPDRSYVVLQGVVKKDRQDRMSSIESVEHVTLLDPLDVTLRLQSLSALRDGWLNGKGLAPDKARLDLLATAFEDNFNTSLTLPHLYPTPEGSIQAEWSIGDWEVSLEVDLTDFRADYQAIELATNVVDEGVLDLRRVEDWARLNQSLLGIGGAQA